MTKKILTFSKKFLDFQIETDSVYFGKISKFFFNESFYKADEKIKAYEFCNQLYNLIMPDLMANLNKLHNVNYSLRSWNLMLGPWLRVFIHASYESYEKLDKLLKDREIDEILSIDPKEYDLFTNNQWDLEFATNNENWNCALNSKILKVLESKKKITYKKINEKFFSNYKREKPSKHPIFFILKYIKKIFYFFKNDNYACIYKSNLPLISEKNLEIKIGQFPQFWDFEKNIVFKKFNKGLREKIDLKSEISSNKFEKFLRTFLPFSLPIFIIESFKDLLKEANNSEFPKNPSFIFTCDAFSCEEIFRFYVANKTEKGIPYFVGQHGNCYFTHIHTNFAPAIRDCDKFLSWGLKENNKTIPCFNFKVLGKKKLHNNKGKLLVVFDRLHVSGIPIFDQVSREKKNFDSTLSIISNLNKDIKDQTIGRLIWSYNMQKSYKKNIGNLNIKTDNGLHPIRNLIKESRLTFFSFDSTGILENLALNIPTICYWDNTFGFINPKFIDTYKLLIKAKILFQNPNDLVKHVEKVWFDVNSWWMSSNTQKLIKEFNTILNVPPKRNSLEYLKKVLTQNI